MHALVQDFPHQLTDALTRFGQYDFSPLLQQKYSNIVCAGLGGSGIAASLIQSLMTIYAPIPYIITKSYELPACTGSDTLFLACSHSGNTEETIAATKDAHIAGATIFVITSGGRLKEFAMTHQLGLLELPAGMMPRACYTYAVVAQLLLMAELGYMEQRSADIYDAITTITTQELSLKDEAMMLANAFFQSIPVIYSDDLFAPIAMRLRQQLNENSKILCRNAILPEMNHNEILGRHDTYMQCPVLFLRSGYEHPRTAYRMELTQEIIQQKTTKILEVRGRGTTLVSEMITMIYILDRVSVYLADLRSIDPTEISTIIFLKDKLAKKI